jgi:type II secretory pathway component PulM
MTDQPHGYPPQGGQPLPSGSFPTVEYQGSGYQGSGYQGSGFPASGPMPAQTPGTGFPAPEPRKRGPVIPALAAAVVVFLAAAGVMLFLWLGAGDDVAEAEARLQQSTGVLADRDTEAEEATAAAEKADADLSRVEADNRDLQQEISTLKKCAEPVRDALAAAAAKNDTALSRAVRAMLDNC